MNCLFRNESPNCKGESSEHLINDCIFGSLKSTNVICASCNNHFGNTIDRDLCRFFSPFSSLLSPVTVGKKQFLDYVITSTGTQAELREGGSVRPKKSIIRRNPSDGKKLFIFERDSMDIVTEKILPNEYPNSNYEIGLTDISEEIGPLVFTNKYNFRNVLRAVLLSLLEIQRYMEINYPNVLRLTDRSGLALIRRFVRLDEPARIPWMPIGGFRGIIQEILSKRKFAHSTIIASGTNNDRLVLVASYFGIKPFFFRIWNAGIERSFTYAYQKDLLSGDVDWRISSDCLVPEIEFKGPPILSTWDAVDFATNLLSNSMNEVYGRARIHVDLHDSNQASELQNEFSVLGAGSVADLVQKAVMSRYEHHEESASVRVFLYECLRKRKLKDFASSFRDTIRKVVQRFGVPEGLLSFDEQAPQNS